MKTTIQQLIGRWDARCRWLTGIVGDRTREERTRLAARGELNTVQGMLEELKAALK